MRDSTCRDAYCALSAACTMKPVKTWSSIQSCKYNSQHGASFRTGRVGSCACNLTLAWGEPLESKPLPSRRLRREGSQQGSGSTIGRGSLMNPSVRGVYLTAPHGTLLFPRPLLPMRWVYIYIYIYIYIQYTYIYIYIYIYIYVYSIYAYIYIYIVHLYIYIYIGSHLSNTTRLKQVFFMRGGYFGGRLWRSLTLQTARTIHEAVFRQAALNK